MKKLSDNKIYLKLLEEKEREILKLKKEVKKWKVFATIDYLTRVKNKREGLKILDREMKKIKSTDQVVTICFIDIDNFKNINDEFGHYEGDRLLSKASQLIRKNIRKQDTIFRFGGDEFIIIFPRTCEKQARIVWQRISEELKQVNQNLNAKYSISLSVGFEEYENKRRKTLSGLIKAADRKMYMEKCKIREE